jgi:hypothetical protein
MMTRGTPNYRGIIRQYRTLLKSEENLQHIDFERHELVPRTAADGVCHVKTSPALPPLKRADGLR